MEKEKVLFRTSICVFAYYIGIDLKNEKNLLWIAEEAIEQLPEDWEYGVIDEGENEGIPYFFHSITGESVWNHPFEAEYRAKVIQEREKKKELFRNAVSFFASNVGIDLDNEKDLIWIAEEAIEKLPEEWGYEMIREGENKGILYFFNTITEVRNWDHPFDAQFRAKIIQERQKMQDNKIEKNETTIVTNIFNSLNRKM
jgi:hypothetical protein